MTATSLLALLGGLVMVVGVALASYRWSTRVYVGLRRVASENDVAMQQAAAALGLEFMPSMDYEHPIVGTIPSFGRMRGSIDGVQIRVEVRSDDTLFWTELRAELVSGVAHSTPRITGQEELSYRIQRDGPTLVMRPTVRETGSSQAYSYRVVTDASALGRHVTELVALARSQALL